MKPVWYQWGYKPSGRCCLLTSLSMWSQSWPIPLFSRNEPSLLKGVGNGLLSFRNSISVILFSQHNEPRSEFLWVKCLAC